MTLVIYTHSIVVIFHESCPNNLNLCTELSLISTPPLPFQVVGSASGPLLPRWFQAVGQVAGWQWADEFLHFKKLKFLKNFLKTENLTFQKCANVKFLFFFNCLQKFNLFSAQKGNLSYFFLKI